MKTSCGHKKETLLDFDQITDQIWIGTSMCCQSHFSEKLLSLGIEIDISLQAEEVDRPF